MVNPNDTQDDYILSRDYRSIVRLNHQHCIMKEEYGGLLHPQIPLDDKDNLKIADIGTGSCIWPIELSHILPPTTSIDAVDLSLAQCPPKAWLPKNVTLIAHDAFLPFPESMVGIYDVVHLQLFACIVKENDPAPLVKNLMSLLKPGGYLQWNDVDIDAQRLVCISESPPSATKPTHDMMALMSKPRKFSAFNWAAQLGDVLGHQGLEAVQFERCTISDHNKMWWGLNCCDLCEEYCDGLERESAGPDDAARIKSHREAIRGAAIAAQKGVVVCSSLVLAVGRKAF